MISPFAFFKKKKKKSVLKKPFNSITELFQTAYLNPAVDTINQKVYRKQSGASLFKKKKKRYTSDDIVKSISLNTELPISVETAIVQYD